MDSDRVGRDRKGTWGTHELRSVEKILAVFDRPRSRSVIKVSDETGQALEFERLGRIGMEVERKMKTGEDGGGIK